MGQTNNTAATSVWDQLQNTSGGQLLGHIDSLEVFGNVFKVHFTQVSGEKHILEFCEDTKRELFPNQLATLTVLEAWRANADVRLGLRGPFNSCIQSVAATKVTKIGTN